MQQINLYQPILRKQEKIFSAKTLLQGNLLVLVGLVLLYVYTVIQTQSMQAQLGQVQQQRDEQVKQVAALSAQYPVKAKDESLKGRVERAQAELQHKRRLLAAVEQLGLDGEVSFSEHLAGLARQDLPQIWLHHITLQNGKQVELIGSAYQAEEVPLYLQRLTNERAFNGTAFHSVVIARNEKQPGQVEFTLSTESPLAEGKK
jgi:hypothetical protein